MYSAGSNPAARMRPQMEPSPRAMAFVDLFSKGGQKHKLALTVVAGVENSQDSFGTLDVSNEARNYMGMVSCVSRKTNCVLTGRNVDVHFERLSIFRSAQNSFDNGLGNLVLHGLVAVLARGGDEELILDVDEVRGFADELNVGSLDGILFEDAMGPIS